MTTTDDIATNPKAVVDFFAADGPLSKEFSRYEARPEQVAMASAVYQCSVGHQNLVVEAGTGVGKSMGYLVPIVEIIKSNRTVRSTVIDSNGDTKVEERPRRVVVSTGTINLQKQLFDKELPLLKKLYPWLTYCMAVGSENYLCGARLKKALADVVDNPLIQSEISDLERIQKWSLETSTGLRMDLPQPVSHEAWSLVNRQADLCRCREFKQEIPCFYRKARAQMQEANVVLVNHHLSMLALTLDYGNVIPGFDYIVFDEIHSLEEVATQCFGVEISNFKMDRLVKDARRIIRNAGPDAHRSGEIVEILDMVNKASEQLFFIMRQQITASGKESLRLRHRLNVDLSNVELIEQLNRVSKLLTEAGEEILDSQKSHEVKAVAVRAEEAATEMRDWLLQTEEDHVYQIISENSGKRIVAKSNPIDISEDLKKCLWSAQNFSVVGTSATVSTGGTMKFIKDKLGADGAAELVLASPFNYVNNAVLYIAADLPEPPRQSDPGYDEKLSERVAELVRISGGRAMVLCTSNSSMKTVGQRLRMLTPHLNILIQGEGIERHNMVEQLRQNPKSVIVGVSSFWQGVDLQGDALLMVIILKLPFPNPSDPLFEARSEKIDAVRPGTFRSFNKLSIPEMIIKMKQGHGRLIRSSSDWGCVAILDPRVVTKRYGSTVIGSLPRTQIKYKTAEIDEFFRLRKPQDEPPPAADDFDQVPF